MSIKRMSAVWEHSKHKGSELLLLLALADNASDDGFCWPGTEYLADKIRMTQQSVINLTGKLEESGELYVDHNRRRGNRYLVATSMTEDQIRAGMLRFGYDESDLKSRTKNFLIKAGFNSELKTFDNRIKIAVLEEPSLTVNEPSLPSDTFKSELTAFFGEKEPTQVDLPKRVDLTDPQQQAAYAARLLAQRAEQATTEPWLHYTPIRYYPRQGVSAEALQRVDYLIHKLTGLQCNSDNASKQWQAGLAQVYQEAGGDWKIIKAGIEAAWNRDVKFRPMRPDRFVDEVRKAKAITQNQPKSGWTIPGGSSVLPGEY